MFYLNLNVMEQSKWIQAHDAVRRSQFATLKQKRRSTVHLSKQMIEEKNKQLKLQFLIK